MLIRVILKWVNALITVFPLAILPIPIWLIVLLSVVLFILSYFKPTLEPIPSIIEGGVWGFGIIQLFTEPLDLFFILGMSLFTIWLVTTILYLISWFKLKSSYKKSEPENSNDADEDNEKQIAEPNNRINLPRFSKKGVCAVVALSILLVTSIGINIYQYINNNNLNETIEDNSEEISKLNDLDSANRKTISELENENNDKKETKKKYRNSYFFFKEHAAIVYDDGTKQYHTLDCPLTKNSKNDFWIYNTEQAELLGYRSCSVCQFDSDDYKYNYDYFDYQIELSQ